MEAVTLAVRLGALMEQVHQFHRSIPSFKSLAGYSKKRRRSRSQLQEVLQQLEESINRLIGLETRRQQMDPGTFNEDRWNSDIQAALVKVEVSSATLVNVLTNLKAVDLTVEPSSKLGRRWLLVAERANLVSEKEALHPLKQRAILLQESIVKVSAAMDYSKRPNQKVMIAPDVQSPTTPTPSDNSSPDVGDPEGGIVSTTLLAEDAEMHHNSQIPSGASSMRSSGSPAVPDDSPVQLKQPADPAIHPSVQDFFGSLSRAWFYQELPEYSSRHEAYRKKCADHTCEWILEDSSYRRWIASWRPSFLWLSGEAGTGKSTLVSRIIVDLSETKEGPVRRAYIIPHLVAYFYMGLGYVHSGTDVMLSLLEQLYSQTGMLPNSLQTLSKAPQAPQDPLKYLLDAIPELDRRLGERDVAIVLDAWDAQNMTPGDDFDRILRALGSTSWKVLISTRNETPLTDLHIKLSAKKEAVAHDIATMAGAIIDRNKTTPAYNIFATDDSLRTLFIEHLARRADGQFFWVELELRLRLQQASPIDIHETLRGQDDGGADDIIRLALKDISQQSPQLFDMAQTSLLWLSEIQRPITLEALQEALAFRAQLNYRWRSTSVSDHKPTKEGLIECWKGLVHVDPTTQATVLVHDRLRSIILQTWHDVPIPTLGETCFQYLTSKEIASTQVRDHAAIRNLCTERHFLDYCGHAWVAHAQTMDPSDRVARSLGNLRELVGRLIESQSNLQLALAIFCFDHTRPYTETQWEKIWTSYSSRPLLLMSELGRETVVVLMLKNAGTHAESLLKETNDIGQTPLHVAALKGHVEVTKLLLEAGASPVDLDTSGKSALHYAREKKHEGVFNMLFKRACELWMQREPGQSNRFLGDLPDKTPLLKYFSGLHNISRDKEDVQAFCKAIDAGEIAVALAFVCQGSTINRFSEEGIPVLHHAIVAKQYNPLLVKELLVAGANPSIISQNSDRQSALHLAAKRGDFKLTRLLLNYGAEVNAIDGLGCTALFPALLSDAPDATKIAELLLQHRIRVQRCNDKGLQILHLAAERGYVPFIDVLLKHGADARARAKDKTGYAPIDFARSGRSRDAVRRLHQAIQATESTERLRSLKSDENLKAAALQPLQIRLHVNAKARSNDKTEHAPIDFVRSARSGDSVRRSHQATESAERLRSLKSDEELKAAALEPIQIRVR